MTPPANAGAVTSKARRHRAHNHARRARVTHQLLSRAAEAARPDDRQDCITQVIEANMGVAEALASKYRNRGIADDDLRQVAYLALTKAAKAFEIDAGHDFLSYAVPTIRGELRRHFRDKGWMVRPPRKVQELQGRVLGAESELAGRLGRSPSVTEGASHLDVPMADVEEALAAKGCFAPSSLDKPVGNGQTDTSMGDLFGDLDTGQDAVEARVVLAPVVRRLSERDRKILRLRFFDDCTQREIADAIGVTQTQVSRVLTRIMSSLRSELEKGEDEAAKAS